MSSSAGGDATTRERILDAARAEVAERGASLTLGHVAARARVSRQAVYLHFGDRTGLLLALVRRMDEQLQLGPSLEHVMAAQNGLELIRRTMELHARFNAGIDAVAQMLEGAQYHDEALGQAWRDRLTFRHGVHRRLVDRLAAMGELADHWPAERATDIFHALTLPGPWRELTRECGLSQERYVKDMTLVISRALLR